MQKHILLIGMNFHTYENNIVKCLESLNCTVDKIIDSPKRPHGYGFVPEKWRKKDQARFQTKELAMLTKPYDYDIVLTFVGRYLQPFFLKELRKKNPTAKFILYLWDDLARLENFYDVKDYYDEIITFELKDALKYGFRFVPLYYMPEYHPIDIPKIYDLCTISSEHSDRMIIFRKLLNDNKQSIKYKFQVVTGWLPYIKYLFFGKKKHDELNGLSCTIKPFSTEDTVQLMSESRAILDVQHFTQNGLTNRTLEAMGSCIKLVTTNEEVKYYDFYNPNNICIIDRENPHIDLEFLRSPYEEVKKEIYDKYSLKSWLENILFNTHQDYLNCSWDEVKKCILN